MRATVAVRRYCRLAAIAVGLAVSAVADGPAGVEALRAEVSAERSLFTPGQTLRIRFTLLNPTDQTIEVPDVRIAAGPVALPLTVVYGDASKPSLMLSFDGARPEALRPEKPLELVAGDEPLRLAPRGSVGVEIDLRTSHRELRYAGSHKIEWKPLGGKLGAATFEFRVENRKEAILDTDFGKVTFTLFYDKAPQNVENFLELCRTRFYETSLIHRIIPGFILQGGKPVGGRGETRPDGKTFPAEFHDAPFDLGTIAMALKHDHKTGTDDPSSASCQFIIGLKRNPALDGKYTVIGQASDPESLRTLAALAERPTDANGRPLQPVMIRYFLLYDVEQPRPERLELGGR